MVRRKNTAPQNSEDPKLPYNAEVDEDEFSVWEVLNVLVKRRWYFLVAFFLINIWGVFSRLDFHPTYSNYVKLRIIENKESFDILSKVSGQNSKSSALTHLENLRSRRFIGETQKALDTNVSMESILGTYNTSHNKESDIVTISVTTSNPEYTRKLANALGETYESYDLKLKQKTFDDYEKWIQKNLAEKEIILNTYEDSIKNVYISNPVFLSEGKLKVENLENKIRDKEFKIQEYEQKGKLIKQEIAGLDSQMLKEITYDKPLQKELLALRLNLVKLSVEYGAEHRIIKQIKEKMTAIRSLIDENVEHNTHTTIMVKNPRFFKLMGDLQDIHAKKVVQQSQRKELSDMLTESYQDFSKAPELELKFKRLERKRSAIEQMVTTLGTRLQESQLQKSATPREIFLIEKARNISILQNNQGMSVLNTIGIGIIIAFGLCFLIEFFDPTIKRSKDLTSRFNLQVLGVVPHLHLTKLDHHLELNYDRIDNQIEPFRRILTNISHCEPGAKGSKKTLLITSCVQDEGKTNTSCLMGIASAIKGRKVLIVDTDLRRGSVHKFFCLKNNRGLSNYVKDKIPPEQLLCETSVPTLKVITAGRYNSRITSNVLRKKTIEIIKEMEPDFDLIILDTAPVLKISDTLELISLAGKVMPVFRNKKSTYKSAESMLKQLEFVRANVIGGIYNDVPTNFLDNFYYDDYYNNYKYYDYNDDKKESDEFKSVKKFT